jgi:hypothetical protein
VANLKALLLLLLLLFMNYHYITIIKTIANFVIISGGGCSDRGVGLVFLCCLELEITRKMNLFPG